VYALRDQAADASVCEVPLVRWPVYLIELILPVHVRSDCKEWQPFQLLHHCSAMPLKLSTASVAWQRTAPERSTSKIKALPFCLQHTAEVHLLHCPVAEVNVVCVYALALLFSYCRSEFAQSLYLPQCFNDREREIMSKCNSIVATIEREIMSKCNSTVSRSRILAIF
jgi:hypothetical protein